MLGMYRMSKVFIIAEAGINHNGNIEIAKKMIDAASEAGVDAIKFQTFQTEKLVCKNAEKATYQKENTNDSESQFDMLKSCELSKQDHIELIKHCREKNIRFLSTPFDIDSVHLLVELEIPIIKIPSGEITNLPYLRTIAKTGKDIIISTGMSQLEEVRKAIKVLQENGSGNITILHCNTQYPTPMEDVNLRAMVTMKNELDMAVGYSDHTIGIEVSIAAVALGAMVIEKHFTLDRRMKGPDQQVSIEPQELKQMVDSIRNIERALGNKEKVVSPSEAENKTVARKSIVAAKTIRKGELFTEDNLTVKRPGTGISPMCWDIVVGKVSDRDYEIDELINL